MFRDRVVATDSLQSALKIYEKLSPWRRRRQSNFYANV